MGDEDCAFWLDGALEPSNIDVKANTGDSGVSWRESLRFLCRDVMKVWALFPNGNKAYRRCDRFDFKRMVRRPRE